jgi:hypothetical protein
VKFGPISKSDLERLKGLLDSQGAFYHVTYSPEDLEAARESRRTYLPTSYPSYSGPMNYIYIEIELKDLMIVRGELERMGFAVAREVPAPLEEVPEYLCPKGDFVASTPGLCPKHQLELLEFSAYADHLRNKKSLPTWLAVLFIFVVLAIFIWMRFASRDPLTHLW